MYTNKVDSTVEDRVQRKEKRRTNVRDSRQEVGMMGGVVKLREKEGNL